MTKRLGLLLGVVLTAPAPPLVAQFETASVLGRVRDTSGAVVPAAVVTLSNTKTSGTAATKTDNNGNYEFFNVRIGEYTVKASAAGFATAGADPFQVVVSARQRVDLTMQLSQNTETVTVTAAVSSVESDTSDRGQVVGAAEIENIPLNGRNYADLALLAPGVNASALGDIRDGVYRESSFNVNGLRSSFNNFSMDGVDNNAYGTSNQGYSNQVTQASPDALQQFKVTTNNYSAEYGRAGGAVINASLKSGTNRVHGSVFEFLRNTDLNAVGFFKPLGDVKPVLIQNQFGGVLGGPIVKNKTFFFASYEGFRRISRTLTRATLPTLEQRQGILGIPVKNPYTGEVFADGVIPPSQQTAFARKVLNDLPAPNKPGFANNFESLPRRKEYSDKADVKIDRNFSARLSGFGRASQRKANVFEPSSIPGLTGGQANGFVRQVNQQLAFGFTYTLNSTSLLEARLGLSRTLAGKTPEFLGFRNMQEIYGIPGLPTEASVAGGLNTQSISGYTGLGRQNSNPQHQDPFVVNPRVTYSRIVKRHSLKMGYEYQAINTDIEDFHPKYGQDSYAGQFSRQALGTAVLPAGLSAASTYNLADFIYGARSQYQLTNTTVLRYRQRMHFGFLQDDWKLSPKLTLNLGTRYEFATPQWEADGRLANFDPAAKKLIQAKASGSLHDRALVNPDRNNWAPRLGLAYALTAKTAIRAGYGVSYIHFNRLGGENILGYNPPTVNTVQVDQLVTQGLCGAGSNPLTCFTPTEQGYPANLTVPENVRFLLSKLNYTPPDTRTGYVQAWHFTIQRELFSKFVLDVAYAGNHSVKLIALADLNSGRPNASAAENIPLNNRRPLSGFSIIQESFNGAWANYNALQVKLERRFAAGLYFLDTFTWSKAMDNISGHLEASNGDNSRIRIDDLNADKGVSSYNIPFNSTTVLIYDAPYGRGRKYLANAPAVLNAMAGGWRLTLNNVVTSGRPVNIGYSPSSQFQVSSYPTYRPNYLDGPILTPAERRTENNWFNRAAFAAPTDVTRPFGNLGRNVAVADAFYQLDLSVHKEFALREGWKLQFRGEAFNLLNTTNFKDPQGNINNQAFGTITATRPARQMQFALKLLF